jgi:hypothetical protein
MNAAAIPTTIVSQMGMRCLPGTTSRPSAPTTMPTKIALMIPVIVMTPPADRCRRFRRSHGR